MEGPSGLAQLHEVLGPGGVARKALRPPPSSREEPPTSSRTWGLGLGCRPQDLGGSFPYLQDPASREAMRVRDQGWEYGQNTLQPSLLRPPLNIGKGPSGAARGSSLLTPGLHGQKEHTWGGRGLTPSEHPTPLAVGLEEGEGGEGDPSVGPSLRQRGRAHHLGPCTVQSPSPKAGTMEVDSHSGQCKGAVPWWGLDSGALGMFGGVRGRVGGSERAEERGRQGLGAKRSPPGLLHPERKTKPWVKGKTCRGGSRRKWQEASAG